MDKLERLEGKVDKIVESLGNMDKTLAVNTRILDDHVQGVKELKKINQQLETRQTSTEKDMVRVKTTARVLKWVGGTGMLAGLAKYFLS